MQQDTKVWIILGSVVGILVLMAVTVLVLYCWRRSKRRVRGFSLRSATPLDDAEFESWRRPSQYTRRPETYGIRPVQRTQSREGSIPSVFEKELSTYDAPQTPSSVHMATPLRSPIHTIRKPERTRRKSSTASSIADRPPTPYSPAAQSPTSIRKSQAQVHYPSMTETSAFRFELKPSQQNQHRRDDNWI